MIGHDGWYAKKLYGIDPGKVPILSPILPKQLLNTSASRPFPMFSRCIKGCFEPQGARGWSNKYARLLADFDQRERSGFTWASRKPIAIFRGSVGKCHKDDSRSHVVWLSVRKAPDLLDARPTKVVKGEQCPGCSCNVAADYMPMGHWEKYKYVLHLGQGNLTDTSRWGDRLKLSYLSRSVVLQVAGSLNVDQWWCMSMSCRGLFRGMV